MRVVVTMARLSGASELLDITGAHIDACLFHGYAGLDFAGCWYAAERGCGSRRRSTCRHWTCCTGTATAGTRIPPPPPTDGLLRRHGRQGNVDLRAVPAADQPGPRRAPAV